MHQGRTDAWIAHQLEVGVQDIARFKRDHELTPGDEAANGSDFDDEIDLRAEDDARIAAELEEQQEREREEAASQAAAEKPSGEGSAEDGGDTESKPGRRRGRRGGRSRRRSGPTTLEGTFDHGEEGYGLWLDPSVADDPVYAEHWAGHRSVEVTIEEEQIVIRRAGGDDDE